MDRNVFTIKVTIAEAIHVQTASHHGVFTQSLLPISSTQAPNTALVRVERHMLSNPT
jgi:hypothetical protein